MTQSKKKTNQARKIIELGIGLSLISNANYQSE